MNMNFSRKHIIVCHSEAEMNRRADALIEKGIRAEREVSIPAIGIGGNPSYHVVYWKKSA